MSQVKTAISIDEGVFKEADLLAKKAHISRSHFFEKAVAECVKKERGKALTEQLNRAFEECPVTAEEKRQVKATRRYQARRAQRQDP